MNGRELRFPTNYNCYYIYVIYLLKLVNQSNDKKCILMFTLY